MPRDQTSAASSAPNHGLFDAAVVGGGPAGMAAAMWIARNRLSVCLIDSGRQRNIRAAGIHGYLGFDDPPAAEFIGRVREQLARYSEAQIIEDEVTFVDRTQSGFKLGLSSGPIEVSGLVLATGVSDELPDIAGLEEHFGQDALHCPLCDGYETKGLDVVVIGSSDEASKFAVSLSKWAAQVTLVTGEGPLDIEDKYRSSLEDRGVVTLEDKVTLLTGPRGRLESVELASGTTVKCHRIFLSAATTPNTFIARSLGCDLTEQGYVSVDHSGATSVEGVFAAGDVTPGLHLVQIAAGQGAQAGISCAEYVLTQR